MPRSTLWSAGALFGLAASALPGQQADPTVRRATFVRVVDGGGAALGGATVTFCGGVPHLGAEVAPTDVQVVAGDARGRAQAKLLPGLCYVAWAVVPGADAAPARQSPVVSYFGAGALVELRCVDLAVVRRVPCSGAEAWRDLGPLRYFVVTPFPGTELELPLGADGALAVPPGPFASFDVRTRDGQPLWSVPTTTETIAVPPPQSIAVHAEDEQGAPLAGVLLRHRTTRRAPWRFDALGGVADGQFRDLGTTGADGKLTVVVPYAGDPQVAQTGGDLLLFASAPGRPAVAGGVFSRSLLQDDRKCAAWADGELRFSCARVEPLRGKGPTVPAGTMAHLSGVCKLIVEQTSYAHDARSFLAPVTPDGSFVFTDVPAQLHSSRLTLVPPAGSSRLLPLFPALEGRTLPPELVPSPDDQRQPQAPPEVAELRLQVTEPDGGPARGVVAFVVPDELRGVLLRDSLVRVPLDAAGAANLTLLPGAWILFAASTNGSGAVRLELPSGLAERKLTMDPLARMRLLLRDAEGEPIAGAQVQWRGSQTRASGDPLQFVLQGFATHMRSQLSTLRTNAQGRIDIDYVPCEGLTYRLRLGWDGGASAEFVLERNDTPLELRPK